MKRSLYFLIAITLFACADLETDLPTAARPVVQAYLIPGQTPQIEVWRETLYLDTDTVIDVQDLGITIETGGRSYGLTPMGEGKYSNNDLVVEEGKIYNLRFAYNGREVTASTDIPAKPKQFSQSADEIGIPTNTQVFNQGYEFPDPIELKWSNPDNKYYLVLVQVAQDNPTLINTSNSSRPPLVFRNNPMQTNTYRIMPQQLRYYSLYRVILLQVTEDYAALYQQNGTSSINIKTPFTNVTNGLGIFTGVNSDTLYVTTRPVN